MWSFEVDHAPWFDAWETYIGFFWRGFCVFGVTYSAEDITLDKGTSVGLVVADTFVGFYRPCRWPDDESTQERG